MKDAEVSTRNLTLSVNPAQAPAGYLVELRDGEKPVAQVRATLDPESLLLHEHSLSPHDYGMALFEALVAGEVGRAYQRLLGNAGIDTRVRVQLVVSPDAQELQRLPWERLFHPLPDGAVPLACSAHTPFSRFLVTGKGDQPPFEGDPIRLLAAIANPSGLPAQCPELDVATEVESFAHLCDETPGRLVGTLIPGRTGLPEELQLRLERQGWSVVKGPTSWKRIQANLHGKQILHILAHGQLKGDSAYLLLEGEASDKGGEGGLIRVLDQDIVAGLSGVDPLPQLVFLAACESAKRPERSANPFVGLAPRLVERGVPGVVAMQDLVPMDLAHEIAASFYRRLLEHGRVDLALNESRAPLYQRNAFEWAIPVLFLRSADGQLFAPKAHVPRLPYEPETVFVPSGPFVMGSEPGPGVPEWETPRHPLELPAYRIGRFPITQREYAEFILQDKAQEVPFQSGWFNRKPPADRLEHPVAGVSWAQALAYCDWLSRQTGRRYRLPGEAEWEKAARGIDGRRYPWGEDWDGSRLHWAAQGAAAVGSHPEGASPYGCEDPLGNLEEWTRTLWGNQWQRPESDYRLNPRGGRELEGVDSLPAQGKIVHRGGSFRSGQDDLYCARRGCADPESQVGWRGFRVLLEI